MMVEDTEGGIVNANFILLIQFESVFYFQNRISCSGYPIYVGPLVIKQNTMPSPAQIMFMSSLINNVPKASPALLSI